MQIITTKLPGVLQVKTDQIFLDHRGHYLEIYNEKKYQELFYFPHFVQQDISYSRKNVLRGLHGADGKTCKLITCLLGSFYLVVADPKTQQWISFTLMAFILKKTVFFHTIFIEKGKFFFFYIRKTKLEVMIYRFSI